MTGCPVCGAAGLPLLGDLYSGAGGAGYGYRLAGFHIVGFDIVAQPRYPGCFVQADVNTLDLAGVGADAWHASPPCTDHRKSRRGVAPAGTGWMLAHIRGRLEETGRLWVIENVPGADMRADYRLCGCMYGLARGPYEIRRERWFETSWRGFALRPPCVHTRRAVSVVTHGARIETPGAAVGVKHIPRSISGPLMGIEWMNNAELGNAIPPAYTADIGADLMATLTRLEGIPDGITRLP